MAVKTKRVPRESKVPKVPRVSKAKGISVPVFSATGTKSTMTLSEAIFGQKPNKALLSQAVRIYLSNQRKAHAKTKGRGDVRYTTAKIFKQKGTGHARHGDRGAPIYVGGGIAHGPRGIQNYKLSMPSKMKKEALISALSSKMSLGQVIVADLEKIEPKTKKIFEILKKTASKNPMCVIFDKDNVNLTKSARNIKGVSLIPANELSAYHALAAKTLILTREAVEIINKRFMGEK